VNSETWTVGHVGPTYEELATNPPLPERRDSWISVSYVADLTT